MKIGELFLELGVKGGASATAALGGIRKSLGDVKSMSLGAKAAIAGAVFALERLMSSSTRAGTGILNFADATGLGHKRLQEWQYAARRAGMSNEELQASVESVQGAMNAMLTGKGAPAGLDNISQYVDFDISKASDAFYVMQKLQEAAQKMPTLLGNEAVKSFGISSNMIAAMRRNAFRGEIFSQAPTYTREQLENLNEADASWRELGHKIQMAVGEFSAGDGKILIKNISEAADGLLKLVSALTVLADKLSVFESINVIIRGWGDLFGFLGKQVEDIGEVGPWEYLKDSGTAIGEANRGRRETGAQLRESMDKNRGVLESGGIPFMDKNPWESKSDKKIEVNQNFSFGTSESVDKISDAVKKATMEALYQSNQAEVN